MCLSDVSSSMLLRCCWSVLVHKIFSSHRYFCWHFICRSVRSWPMSRRRELLWRLLWETWSKYRSSEDILFFFSELFLCCFNLISPCFHLDFRWPGTHGQLNWTRYALHLQRSCSGVTYAPAAESTTWLGWRRPRTRQCSGFWYINFRVWADQCMCGCGCRDS